MLGYFTLLGLFLLILGAGLYPGIAEWLYPKDDNPLSIDVDYVRSENYFGTAFREKMQSWLESSGSVSAKGPLPFPVESVLETSDGKRILMTAPGQLRFEGECSDWVYCAGDLSLGQAAIFHREIYVRGRVEIGTGARVQAVAADGDLVAGENAEVAGWLDAQKKIILRSGTTVRSRVNASESVELESRVFAQSIFAPLISTPCYQPDDGFLFESELRAQCSGSAEKPGYLDGVACVQLSADTWLVQGSLELKDGMIMHENLVVRGALRSGRNCRFLGDLKAVSLETGVNNIVASNITCEDRLIIGENSKLSGNVIASTDIQLATGVRAGGKHLVAISAAGRVLLERNVGVCGKISSAKGIITL